MPRLTRSCTRIPLSASRRQGALPRSALFGSRCETRAQARAPCWCKPPPGNGRSSRPVARRRTARSRTRKADANCPMARWRRGRAASSQPPPKEVALKDPKDFVLIGKPLKRFDTPDKATGKVVYGIDAILPGMKFATLAACPGFGGKVGKVDDSAAKKIPGVQKIVVLDDLVAVVGDHMWAATKGLEALVIDWDEGPNARISSKDIWQHLRSASEKDGVVAKSEGDIAKGLATR